MTPADLIRAFETLADAPEGVARLRELVLQLAVRGKLVPQDPSDEPASELLKRIAAEKARLVNAGQIRKQEEQPDISASDVPFAVPAGWTWTRFGTLTDSRLGKMLDKAKNAGPLRPYLRNANLQWFQFVLDDVKHLRLKDAELDECSLRVGDLVVCEGGEPGRCAVCDESVEGMVYQKALHRVRPYCGVDVWYLAYLLRCDTGSGRLSALFTGATIKHLTGRSLGLYTVPLPPLAEQRRIVANVDSLMGLLDRLEAARTSRDTTRAAMRDAALAALRDADDAEAVELAWARVAERMDDLFTEPADVAPLRQTILQLAVRGRLVPQDPSDEPASELLKRIAAEKARLVKAGEIKREKELPAIEPDEVPFDVPSGWQWSRLGNITSHITSGSRGWNQYYAASGATFIRSQDIKYDRLEYDSRAYVQPPRGAEGTRTRVVAGDWVLTITGANVGKCALLDTVPDEAYVSQHVALLRPANLELGRYGHLWLVGDSSGRFILLKDSYGAKPGLNLQQLRSLVVPLPPLAEQHRIVAKVESLLALCAALETRLAAGQTAQAAFASAAVHHLDGE